MAAIATFLGRQTDWASCKKLMADLTQFKAVLNGYDKKNVQTAILEKVREFDWINEEHFYPQDYGNS